MMKILNCLCGLILTLLSCMEISASQNPATFKCTEDSPVGGPVWSTNYPPVEMRHIFCGEIVKYKATGFHSLSSTTNWESCAAVIGPKCQFFPNGNGYCKDVFIRDASPEHCDWEPKDSGSTLWPPSLSPVKLVPLLQNLFNNCKPATKNAALCFDDCNYKDNSNYFDIVIGTDGNTIVTAYPAQRGMCAKHPEWQDCDGKYCRGLAI